MAGRGRSWWFQQGSNTSVALGLALAAIAFHPDDLSASEIVSRMVAPASHAATGAQTLPPIGWVQFCRSYANDPRKPCNVGKLPALDVVLDANSLLLLTRVNDAVNAAIEPVTDMEHWGVIDKWDYPDDKRGDCEDYVIEKRHRLMKLGFPRQALLVTVVRDRQGEGHAVLTVKTDKGDFILDNQNEEIVAWTETGYHFIKRQSQDDPMIWVSLGADRIELTSGPKKAASQP